MVWKRQRKPTEETKLNLLSNDHLNTSLVYEDGTAAFRIVTDIHEHDDAENHLSLHQRTQRMDACDAPVTTIYRLYESPSSRETIAGVELNKVDSYDSATLNREVPTRPSGLAAKRSFNAQFGSGSSSDLSSLSSTTKWATSEHKYASLEKRVQDWHTDIENVENGACERVVATIQWHSWPDETLVELNGEKHKLSEFMRSSDNVSKRHEKHVTVAGDKTFCWKDHLELYDETTKVAKLCPPRSGLVPSQRRNAHLKLYTAMNEDTIHAVLTSCIIVAHQRKQAKQALAEYAYHVRA